MTLPLHRQRIAICAACPEFTLSQICKKCGCLMEVKTRLAWAKCPLNKW